MKRLNLVLLVGMFSPNAQASIHDVFGLWLTEAKDAHVQITNCGDGSPCGKLVWVNSSTTPTDRDAQNPNVELQNRPLLGVPIVWGYSHDDKGWKNGKIYNPEDGKTFKSSIKRREDGTLIVKGCLGPICRKNIWKLVDEVNLRETFNVD